jgi:hypothetical protein
MIVFAVVATLSVTASATAGGYNGYMTNEQAEKLRQDLEKLDKALGKEKSLPDRVREKIREAETGGNVGGD